jgi:hypothetical protein
VRMLAALSTIEPRQRSVTIAAGVRTLAPRALPAGLVAAGGPLSD